MTDAKDSAQHLANLTGRRVVNVTMHRMPSTELPDFSDPDAMKKHYADFCSCMTLEHFYPEEGSK